jgi:hypothetical protein
MEERRKNKPKEGFFKRGDDKVFPLVVKGLILSDNVSINHTNKNDMLINAKLNLKQKETLHWLNLSRGYFGEM